jgi:hypothetical protein
MNKDVVKGSVIVGAFMLITLGSTWAVYTDAGGESDKSVTDIAGSMTDTEVMDAKAQQVDIQDHFIDKLLASQEPNPVQSSPAAEEASPEVEPTPEPKAEPMEPSPVEATATTEPCRPYEIEQNLRGCGSQKVASQPSSPPPPRTREPAPSYEAPSASPAPDAGSQHPLMVWKELVGERQKPIIGRRSHYAGPVIKTGCRLVAVVEEQELRIPSGYKHGVTLNVRTAVNDCPLPEVEGIRITGEMEFSPGEQGLVGTILRCSDRNPRRKAVDCKGKGRIQSITGSEVLEGIIYDNSGWGLFFESLVSVGLTPAIAKLTETAATAKTIFAAESSQMIAGTMTKALDRISEKIGRAFDGKEIRLSRVCNLPNPQTGNIEKKPCPVIVVISFTDDVVF